ncbi:unnamed protein product [Closterium sp. NIES-64]|nr:unnamed protein product [Closterium sp. NIES-64]
MLSLAPPSPPPPYSIRYESEFYSNVVHHWGIISWGAVDPCQQQATPFIPNLPRTPFPFSPPSPPPHYSIRYESEFYSNVVHHRGIISWGAVDPCQPDRLVGFITARLVPPAEAQGHHLMGCGGPLPAGFITACLVPPAEAQAQCGTGGMEKKGEREEGGMGMVHGVHVWAIISWGAVGPCKPDRGGVHHCMPGSAWKGTGAVWKEGGGECSMGVCSMGECSMGVCSMGVCSMGECSMGVCSMGVCSMGECSMGVCSMGVCSMGECSMGVCSMGGADVLPLTPPSPLHTPSPSLLYILTLGVSKRYRKAGVAFVTPPLPSYHLPLFSSPQHHTWCISFSPMPPPSRTAPPSTCTWSHTTHQPSASIARCASAAALTIPLAASPISCPFNSPLSSLLKMLSSPSPPTTSPSSSHTPSPTASHLVHLLLSHAASLPHCAAIYLHVVAYNAPAIRFYRSLRFCYRRRLSRFYYLEGGEYDALLFARYVNGWLPPDSSLSRCYYLEGGRVQLVTARLQVRLSGLCLCASLSRFYYLEGGEYGWLPPDSSLSRFYYSEGGEYDALLFARYAGHRTTPVARADTSYTATCDCSGFYCSVCCHVPTTTAMARRSFSLQIFGASSAMMLVTSAVALLAQMLTATRALPVSEMIATMKSNGVYYVQMERLFALDGTKDISGVTILVPRSPSGETYASHDNTTRKYNQAIADALTLMRAASGSESSWTAASQNLLSPAVTKVLLDIWKFQIVKQYLPPSVVEQKYSSGGPWELPTLEGQPLWMTYISPMNGGMWNISGMSPQQHATSPLPRVGSQRYVEPDGSPFAYTVGSTERIVYNSPESEVVVYRSNALLLPYNMEALSAYAGATASIFHLLASIGLALVALLLL